MNFVKFSVAVAICGVTWFVGSAIIRSDNRVIIDVPQTVRTADTRTIAPKGPVTQKQADDFIANLPTPHELGQPENPKPVEKTVGANESRGGERVITPELAESMGRGKNIDFSDCIGKTTSECIESAVYAKTYLDGIEFSLGPDQEERCGPYARTMLAFGPRGRINAGCWLKSGREIRLWIFMPTDSNGNYIKVRGPLVESIKVMPYYLNHSLPEF